MKENVLFITNQIVYPAFDGGKKISLSLIMSLHDKGHNVTVVSFNVMGHNEEPSVTFFKEKGIKYIIVKTKKFYKRHMLFTYILDYFLGIFSILPRYVQNRLDHDIKEKINKIIHENNITRVYLDSMWLAENIDNAYTNLVWLIEHNIEYILSRELAKCEKNIIKKFLLYYESLRIFFYEKKNLTKLPHIIFLSSYDRDFAIKKFRIDPTKCILNDNKLFLEYSIEHKGDGNYLLFPGSLTFLPNLEGILWFLHHCFPHILKHYPDITLKITGPYDEKIKNKILKKYTNVVFTNIVSDDTMKSLLTHCLCVISPILSGSGIKIKNIEAIQIGVPIVMTEFSARGIENYGGDKFKFCNSNSPEEFTSKLLDLIKRYTDTQR